MHLKQHNQHMDKQADELTRQLKMLQKRNKQQTSHLTDIHITNRLIKILHKNKQCQTIHLIDTHMGYQTD